jgi:UDP-4-amino-4,6-dideoxy-N-acetyl-beta-L-altrosamine transaminase
VPEFLPYGRQSIDDDDIEAVIAVLRSDFLTTGPAVTDFETALAKQASSPFAIGCSNGTAALHLATMVLGLGEGDAAIVPSMTFLATANAVRYTGAEVIFADVDPNTGLMTVETLQEAMSRADDVTVRAVLPVHLAGQCADMPAIGSFAKAKGLHVIEDAAHAIGTTTKENNNIVTVGSCTHSTMTTFSFHPVKTMTTGEGGAVTTCDPVLADRLCKLRSHGMIHDPVQMTEKDQVFATNGTKNPWYYEMPELGYNYRITDIQCALGLRQLSKLDDFVARRSELVARYDEKIVKLAPLARPLERVADCFPAWHLYVAKIDFAAAEIERAQLMNTLREEGIGTQVHYIPVHLQPYYRRRYGNLSLPGADAYYAQTLSLPLFPTMVEADVDRVVQALSRCLGGG